MFPLGTISAAALAVTACPALVIALALHRNLLLQRDHHMAEGLLALASGQNVLVVLQSRVDDSALVGIHRLQGHRTFGPLYLIRDILCQGFQRFFALLAVILSIQLHSQVTVAVLVHNQADQIL